MEIQVFQKNVCATGNLQTTGGASKKMLAACKNKVPESLFLPLTTHISTVQGPSVLNESLGFPWEDSNVSAPGGVENLKLGHALAEKTFPKK